MTRIALMIFLVLSVPGFAFGQKIYKCTIDGKVFVQDSICPSEAASAAMRVFPTKMGGVGVGDDSNSSKREELRALKGEMAKLGGPGATSEQVTKNMGKPTEIRTKLVDGEIYEEWIYANGSNVKFKGGRVVSVETVRKVAP
jgi:hypothetical protein